MPPKRRSPGKYRIIAEPHGRPLWQIISQPGHDHRECNHGRRHRQIDQHRHRAATHGVEQGERRQQHRQVGEEIEQGMAAARIVFGRPRRLTQRRHPQRKQQAGQADRHEGSLPTNQPANPATRIGRVPDLRNLGSDKQRNPPTEIKAGGIDRQCSAALAGRKIVRNQRISSRACGCFTNSHPHPRQ